MALGGGFLYSRRCGRRALSSAPAALSRLDLDAAFFWLLLVFLVTVVSFLNLRGSHVALSPTQIAEYEHRTQVLSNSTVYIVEVHKPEGLLSKLGVDDWTRISQKIDYIAFVFDDMPAFLVDDWVARAERVLSNPALPHAERVRSGLGIMLFPCGCMLPNSYFRTVSTRLGGMECILLPGWVLPQEDVHWIPDLDADMRAPCKRQKRIAASRVVSEFGAELAVIRRTTEQIRSSLSRISTSNELTKADTNSDTRKAASAL